MRNDKGVESEKISFAHVNSHIDQVSVPDSTPTTVIRDKFVANKIFVIFTKYIIWPGRLCGHG